MYSIKYTSKNIKSTKRTTKNTDLKIKIAKTKHHVHRKVIEEAAPIVGSLIIDNVLKLDENIINPNIVNDLLNYFYTSTIDITVDNVSSICSAANFFKLIDLLSECEKLMINNLSNNSVIGYYLSSKQLKLKELEKSTIYHIIFNLEYLNNRKDYFELDEDMFSELIDDIKIFSNVHGFAVELFSSIMRWVDYDVEVRHQKIPDLLGKIPGNHYPTENLYAKIFKTDKYDSGKKIKTSEVCSYTSITVDEDYFKTLSYKQCRPMVYFIGGENGKLRELVSKISFFDPINKSWGTVPNMNFQRKFCGTAVIGKKVYVAGGFENSFRKTDSMQVLDFENNSINELCPMPGKRSFCAAAAHDGKIYVAGGSDDLNNRFKTVICYCPKEDRWTPRASMIITRCNPQLVSLNGFLYAIGGRTNTLERYIPEANTWSLKRSMENSHSYLSAVVHRGKIYVCGNDGFEEYTPEEDFWRTLPAPKVGAGAALVSVDDRLLAFGGYRFQTYKMTDYIYEFDFIQKKWITFSVMDHLRRYHYGHVISF